MTELALVLVLLAAVLHAVWNLCAKKAGGGMAFVNLVGIVNLALYAPFVAAYWLWRRPSLPEAALLWIAGSGVLKTSYALLLQRGYRSGDYSLIYPLARGTGPLLSILAAILILRERPPPLALASAALIVGGIFFLADGARLWRQERVDVRRTVGYGLATGCFIASYTVWDRHGVAALAIPPILYDAGTTLVGVLLLGPFSLGRRAQMRAHWRDHKLYVFGVAGLSSIAYILVLTALSFTPVSYIAPVREVSIVIGAFIGVRYLKEAGARRRVWAAVAIALGIIGMAVA